jgi:hypothetical protein
VTLCHQAGEEEEAKASVHLSCLRQWGTIEYCLGQPPDDTEKRGPPGSVYIVEEGSLKEVQQFRIGKKWGLDRRRVWNEGVRGWNSPSRRRRTPHRFWGPVLGTKKSTKREVVSGKIFKNYLLLCLIPFFSLVIRCNQDLQQYQTVFLI